MTRVGVLLGMLASAGAGAAKLTVGPYLQDAREDGFTIAYETDVAARCAVVVDGRPPVETSGTRHEARIIGLPPGVRLNYRVEVDGDKAASASAATVSQAMRSLTFAVYGDTRDNPEIGAALALAIKDDHPDLVLHTGDLVATGGEDALWPRFFANQAPLLSEVPIYPACGNHELHNDPEGEHFKRYFVLPDEGRTRRYYTFRYGPARFIVLDGNGRHDEQARWMQATFEAAVREKVPHLFVLVHQPPLSTGGHCGQAPLQQSWVGLYETNPVRAVFGGHEHIYERLERRGVTYFVTGGGGARLYEERDDCADYDHDARRAFTSEYHYLRVTVAGADVEVTAVRLDKGSPPIETVRLSGATTTSIAGSDAPPLVDSRGPFMRTLTRRKWRFYAAGALVAAGLLWFQMKSSSRRRRKRSD